MKYIIKIGIALTIFVLMGSFAIAMPINIQPIITSEIEISQSIKGSLSESDYNDSQWNETTLETVKEFLYLMPPCDWFSDLAVNMCGLNARYTIIESYKHGIILNEITIKFVDGVSGGHRILLFKSDGQTYYLTNLYKGDNRIVNNQELHKIVRDRMGIDRFGFCDYKEFSDEWHLKYS